MNSYDLDKAVRKIPDFPKKGILFYDITGILQTPEAFSFCIKEMERRYGASSGTASLDAVAAIEARGFLFAAPLARRLGLPMILLRKAGKLPGETREKKFSLEYGEEVIQVHVSDVQKGSRVLLVDDLAATGGTLKASAELLEECGAELHDIFCVIGLPFLPYKKVLADYRVQTLIEYEHQ